MANAELGQVVKGLEISVNLEGISDGELLDLAVPSEPPTQGRRVLVIWLYLTESPRINLKEFDRTITELAEKELERRANSTKR